MECVVHLGLFEGVYMMAPSPAVIDNRAKFADPKIQYLCSPHFIGKSLQEDIGCTHISVNRLEIIMPEFFSTILFPNAQAQ